MTLVSPTRPSVRRTVFTRSQNSIKHLNDRVVLAAVFVALFCLNYAPNFIEALANIFAVGHDLSHSRTVSGAEVLGFVAIAVALKDLKADRLLRWWDFIAMTAIVMASLYPSHVIRAIAMTCVGLLFIAQNDKRIASLGQLCLGLVWIDFWGALALEAIKQWLLPIETAFAFLPLSLFGAFSLDGIIISNGSGHAIEVLEACSAFHNTITTAFIWLSLMKILRLDFHLKHYCLLAIALASVVLLNTARISVMAVSESQYFFWHEGPGLWIVKVTMLTVVFSVFCFGLYNRSGASKPVL